MRSVTERGLRARGYTVTSVPSAEDALVLGDALAAVDVLLTDVRLPGMSGIDLAAGLRAAFPHLPVLVMSGHVGDPAQQAALSAGKYAFLPKPFSLPGLLLRLREVLDSRPSPPDLELSPPSRRSRAQSASWIAPTHTLARADHDRHQQTVVKKLGEAERPLHLNSRGSRGALGEARRKPRTREQTRRGRAPASRQPAMIARRHPAARHKQDQAPFKPEA